MAELPPKSDSRWSDFIDCLAHVQVSNLPVQMLLNRLRVSLEAHPTIEVREHAIAAIYELFSKNQAAMADDIERIFGKEPMQ